MLLIVLPLSGAVLAAIEGDARVARNTAQELCFATHKLGLDSVAAGDGGSGPPWSAQIFRLCGKVSQTGFGVETEDESWKRS